MKPFLICIVMIPTVTFAQWYDDGGNKIIDLKKTDSTRTDIVFQQDKFLLNENDHCYPTPCLSLILNKKRILIDPYERRRKE